ncbi:hypothetical protein B0H19DRAFT_1073714 [Mycena capillaripes]|nr:hypothetical protein B0H19DRAFT_1073714 [Mycena capillaripes]
MLQAVPTPTLRQFPRLQVKIRGLIAYAVLKLLPYPHKSVYSRSATLMLASNRFAGHYAGEDEMNIRLLPPPDFPPARNVVGIDVSRFMSSVMSEIAQCVEWKLIWPPKWPSKWPKTVKIAIWRLAVNLAVNLAAMAEKPQNGHLTASRKFDPKRSDASALDDSPPVCFVIPFSGTVRMAS